MFNILYLYFQVNVFFLQTIELYCLCFKIGFWGHFELLWFISRQRFPFYDDMLSSCTLSKQRTSKTAIKLIQLEHYCSHSEYLDFQKPCFNFVLYNPSDREPYERYLHLHNLNSTKVFLRWGGGAKKENHNQDSAERDSEPNYWKLGKPSQLQAVAHTLLTHEETTRPQMHVQKDELSREKYWEHTGGFFSQ